VLVLVVGRGCDADARHTLARTGGNAKGGTK
jgi:hypothetical protein